MRTPHTLASLPRHRVDLFGQERRARPLLLEAHLAVSNARRDGESSRSASLAELAVWCKGGLPSRKLQLCGSPSHSLLWLLAVGARMKWTIWSCQTVHLERHLGDSLLLERMSTGPDLGRGHIGRAAHDRQAEAGGAGHRGRAPVGSRCRGRHSVEGMLMGRGRKSKPTRESVAESWV